MPSNYILSVFLEVADPQETAAFCCEHLEFTETSRGAQWIEIENGALVLRVVPAASGRSGPPLVLELVTEDLDATCEQLSSLQGVGTPGPVIAVEKDRLERWVETRFGVTLAVTHKLSEDALDEFPELPTELVWQPQAIHLVQEMLCLVPVSFRADARRRITPLAETLAVQEGEVEVFLPHAVAALLRATPTFQREALRAALKERELLGDGDGFETSGFETSGFETSGFKTSGTR